MAGHAIRVSAIAAAMFLAGAPSFAEARPDYADLILTNARVYTLDKAQPWAEAVVIDDGKIVYVGKAKRAKKLQGPATQLLDLKGKTVMPGFISAHDHLVSSDYLAYGVHIYEARTIEEALALIKAYAKAHPEERVIRGIGWTMSNFGRYPTAAELDLAVPDRPAIILDYTIHDAWLNSRAMKAAGIDRNTRDTQPGTAFWVRDAEGNPTGVALEGEWMAPYVAVGAWEPERMIRESTLRQFAIAASHGTTTVQDPGLMTPNLMNCAGMKSDFRIGLSVLAELDRRGELPLRTQVMPFFNAPDCDPADVAEFAVEMKALHDSDTLRIRSIKIHPAANMESYGTPLIEPYADKPTRGHFGVAPETIAKVVLEANRRNIDIVMHAWGDAEVRAGIDAFEQARSAGFARARNALHHLGLVHPDDYPRLVSLKIPLNVTPVFSTDWTGQHLTYIRLLGEARAHAELAVYPDLARAGLNLSISADMPSSGPAEAQAPLYNVEAAVTLRTPIDGDASKPFPPGRRGMSLEAALRAVTIDAAWQLRMEDKVGSLERGKYADIVILEKNPFDIAPTEISKIKVLGTIKGGKFTHRNGF